MRFGQYYSSHSPGFIKATGRKTYGQTGGVTFSSKVCLIPDEQHHCMICVAVRGSCSQICGVMDQRGEILAGTYPAHPFYHGSVLEGEYRSDFEIVRVSVLHESQFIFLSLSFSCAVAQTTQLISDEVYYSQDFLSGRDLHQERIIVTTWEVAGNDIRFIQVRRVVELDDSQRPAGLVLCAPFPLPQRCLKADVVLGKL